MILAQKILSLESLNIIFCLVMLLEHNFLKKFKVSQVTPQWGDLGHM